MKSLGQVAYEEFKEQIKKHVHDDSNLPILPEWDENAEPCSNCGTESPQAVWEAVAQKVINEFRDRSWFRKLFS